MIRKYPFDEPRRRKRRRLYKRKFPPLPKRISANQKASRALILIRKLKQEIEVKEITSNTACTTAADDTWSDIPLVFGVPQTADQQTAITRIGKKIMIKSIAFHITATLSSTETAVDGIRIVIFIDRRPKATQVTESEPFSLTTWQAFYETQKMENKGRFQFIFDKLIYFKAGVKLSETAAGTYNNNARLKTKQIRFFYNKPFEQLYTGTGGLITNLQKNAVYLCACTSNATTTNTVTAYYKVKFTDS